MASDSLAAMDPQGTAEATAEAVKLEAPPLRVVGAPAGAPDGALTAYELARLENIRRNRETLEALDLPALGAGAVRDNASRKKASHNKPRVLTAEERRQVRARARA
jgi:hypothetical protein